MRTLETVRALVARHVEPPADEAPLEVDSLVLVSIVEDLEDTFAFRIRAEDLVPENFESVGVIARFVDARVGR